MNKRIDWTAMVSLWALGLCIASWWIGHPYHAQVVAASILSFLLVVTGATIAGQRKSSDGDRISSGG